MQVYFPGQEEDEKIVIFVRRHWVTFLPSVIITLIMSLVPFISIIALNYFTDTTEYRDYIALALSAYLLFVATVFFVSWLDYYFDVIIITDERLVHIEQRALFNRQISELNLLRVQNVSTDIKGILPTFFDFGCLIVETAGETGIHDVANEESSNFTMENLPHPNQLAKTILHMHEEMIRTRGQAYATTQAEGEIHPHDTPDNITDNDNQPDDSSDDQKPPEGHNTSQDITQPSPPNPPSSSNHMQNITKMEQIADEGQLKDGETVDL